MSSECGNILVDVTVSTLGIGAECSRPDVTTLKIYYGSSYTPGAMDLHLMGNGFGPSSTFPRAILPKFTLTSSTLADKYQDFVNTWTVNPMGTGLELSYVWLYDLGVDGPLLPLGNKTSFVFNYWEAMPEKYRIKVIQTDLGNINFEYSVTSPEFNVLSSCSTPGDCRTVVWTLSNDPGTTPVDCTDDNLIQNCIKSNSGALYMITADYVAGIFSESESGDSSLKLDPSKFASPSLPFVNFADTILCGSSLVFPVEVSVEIDAQSTQPSGSEFIMSGLVIEGLATTVDYSLEWEATNGGETSFCTTSSVNPTCTIPAYALNVGTSYIYSLKLLLICNGNLWQTATFAQFNYAGNIYIYIFIYIYIYMCSYHSV